MPSNWRSRPRPVEKSTEQGRPHNRRPRENGRRRDGGGWVRSSVETGQRPWGGLLFFTLNREDFSFVIHLDRQPRTSRRREAQTGSRARSGSRSERTLDAVEHSRTLMEWWPFLIFHRGGLRIKVINNRGPAAHNSFVNKRGRGEMTKSPITLQELRRRIYVKAKAEKSWRFLRQGFGWKRWSRRWVSVYR